MIADKTAGRLPFMPRVLLPMILAFGGLALWTAASWTWKYRWIADLGAVLFGAGILYSAVQCLGRLVLRQWRAGFSSLGRIVMLAAALLPASAVVMMLGVAGPSEDGFAEGLTNPTNIEVSIPAKESEITKAAAPQGEFVNDFQNAAIAALRKAPSGDSNVVVSIPSLRALAEQNRAKLERHLASSPAWRVYEMHGETYAIRRWQAKGRWRWDMHGYYSNDDLELGDENGALRFQARVLIGLTGKSWMSRPEDSSWVEEGKRAHPVGINIPINSGGSKLVIRCGPVVLELFEEAAGPERRFMKAAIEALEKEFKRVLDAKEELGGLSAGSIRSGEPSMELTQGMQPGIYQIEGWLNPAEAGTVYLQAYEVTKGTRLSKGRLHESSNERIGWTGELRELFLYNGEVTIDEGDWGQPYTARFELWFKPASGGAERKLLERNFKIEGWQR